MAKYMEELKEMLCEELDKIAKKGELTAGSLDAIDKLTHSIKSIVTIIAMEDSGYSNAGSSRGGSYRGGSYEGSYDGSYDGSYEGSFRRGRSATTGRFVSRASGRSYDGGYSRDGMREKLEELMENAPDDHTRQELQRLINKM